MRAKACNRILNDNRLVTGPWHGAAEWGATDWFPQMNRAGLKQFPWVYSPSAFSQLSTYKTISVAKNETIRTFGNAQEARKWLLTQ